MTAADLIALAERVEAATGPDRELDSAIYCAVTVAQGHLVEKQASGELEVWPRHDKRFFTVQPGMILPYTASLDAAMTLVPKGASWSLYDVVGKRESVRMYDGRFDVLCNAASPALALTAAALRARAAQMETSNA